MQELNPYKVLQVDLKASQEVIKAAYRALIKQSQNHPDLGGDVQSAQVLNEAYSLLSDPQKRSDIDRYMNSDFSDTSFYVYCLYCSEVQKFRSERALKYSFCPSCGRAYIGRRKKAGAASSTKSNDPMEVALFLFSHRLYPRAIEHLKNMLANDARNADLLYLLGMCHYRLNRFKDASQTFLKNVQYNDDHYLSQLYLGKTLMQMKQYTAAITHLRTATALRQDYLKPMVVLANCLFRSGKYLEAAKCLEDILAKDSLNEQAHFLLGVSTFKQGLIKKAKTMFRDGMKKFPANPKFKSMLHKIQNFQ